MPKISVLLNTNNDSSSSIPDISISNEAVEKTNVVIRKCYACGSTETYVGKNSGQIKPYAYWYLNHDAECNMLCYYCFLYLQRTGKKSGHPLNPKWITEECNESCIGFCKHRRRKYDKEWNRNYKLANPEIVSLRHKSWRVSNPELHREQKKRHRHKRRLAVIEFFGGKCIKCGITDFRVLQLDHINGGGRHDNRLKRHGSYSDILFKWSFIKNNPDIARKEFQLLCCNCNWIKRWENKEYTKKLYGVVRYG